MYKTEDTSQRPEPALGIPVTSGPDPDKEFFLVVKGSDLVRAQTALTEAGIPWDLEFPDD